MSVPSKSTSDQTRHLTGYGDPAYAASLAFFGRPLRLPACGGHLLERSIPATDLRDGMGCYPLFRCRDWRKLGSELDTLQQQLVSVVMVTDPLGDYDDAVLRSAFPDRVIRFKSHFLVDLTAPAPFSAHHRRYARKALRCVQVERVAEPETALDEWRGLYAQLVARHRVRGIATFGRDSFQTQLSVAGIVAYRARIGDETVAMHLWYSDGHVGYYHLGASSPRGYADHAAFGLMARAIADFKDEGLRCLDLGAASGTAEIDDGLAAFKRGWANASAPTWLCGRILDRDAYTELALRSSQAQTAYFPAYRSGDLG